MSENKVIKSAELVLDKHVDFIENYGKKHEKYVIFFHLEFTCLLFGAFITS